MANLLDQASIVLTPTAYDNGKVLCAKPSEAPYGDFDFSRNSAATRVNAQGLVENVQILSSNLVQNGDFSEEGVEKVSNGSFTNGSTDWTIENTWTIGDGVANGNGANGSTEELLQPNSFTLGKTYKVVYQVLNYVSGSIRFQFAGGGATLNGTTRTADGTFTEYIVATANHTKLNFRATNFFGSITNISVKEVGMDWNLVSANASIGENKLIANSVVTENIATQSGVVPISKPIILKFDLILNSGGFRVLAGSGGTATNITTSGTYTLYETSGTGGTLTLQSRFGSFDGSVTNLSIIEITTDTNLPRINYEVFSYQDALGSEEIVNGDFATDSGWNKGTGWSISNGAASYDGLNGTRQLLSNSGDFATIGKTYKITFDVLEQGVGANSAFYGGVRFSNENLSVGSYVFYVTAINSDRFSIFGRDGGVFSIDNVSVKEVLGQEVVPDSGCGHWLFEPQSTNLITYSEDFTQWGTVGSPTITSNYGISPDGTQNSTRVQFSTNDRIFESVSASGDITFSVYLKGSGTIRFRDNGGTNTLDVTLTSEWTRYILSFNATITNIQLQKVGSGGTDLQIWGAQVETLSYPTSLIPTSGSSVTRNQDVCTNGGSLATINSTEGVLYAEIAALVDTDIADRVISLSDNTITNRVELKLAATGSIQGRFDSATSDTTLTKIGISTTNTNKIALYWESGKCALWINGIKEQENLTFNTFASNALIDLSFNSAFSGGSSNFFGKTKALAVWKEALSDQELTDLTTI